MARPNNSFRVGLFLTILIAALATTVFLLGEQHSIFRPRATLYVEFDDVGGLMIGNPVRLAGLDIGSVTSIQFSEKPGKPKLRVAISVDSRYLAQIREDSAAFVGSKGLLGDKLVGITVGDMAKPQLENGAEILNVKPGDFEKYLEQFAEILESVKKVVANIDVIVADVASEQVRADFKRIMNSTANIIEEVDKGDGTLHSVIYDKKYGDKLYAIMRELEQTLATYREAGAKVQEPIDRVNRILAQVEKGPGMAHSLFYAESGAKMVDELSGAATEVHQLLTDIRTGDGLIHSLVYGQNDTNFLASLTDLSDKLNGVVGRIERGEGTIGALVQDPTLFEDLKALVGNVQRSWTFRTLTRLAISSGDLKKPQVEREGKPVYYAPRPATPAAQAQPKP